MRREQRPEVVVITGASAGVGRAVAREFAAHGARIGLLARGEVGLQGAKRDVEALGGLAIAIPTDTADYEQVERAAETVEQAFGPIDIWINDGFVTVFAEFTAITPAEYRRVTEVTYLGFVHGTLAALKRMLPRDHGKIVQVGSALGYVSIPLQSAYCGAKHAILGFSNSVRIELMHHHSNVSLSVAHLPAVNTPQFTWGRDKLPYLPQPVPPIYAPEVVARGIYWLAHQRKKRELWIGLPSVRSILGAKFAPGLTQRYLARVGYRSQMRDQPNVGDRPDNLSFPLDATRDYGAHGVFDAQERRGSPQLWVAEHKGLLALTCAAAGLAGAAGIALAAGAFPRRG
jgi:NAD(P)-dependent dehydrogenase (short-subunit alcohol dehydrogenase family)